MFTDSHAHLSYIADRGGDLAQLILDMEAAGFPFVMDVGTRSGDWLRRQEIIRESTGYAIPQFIHFSCGIWPGIEAIREPQVHLQSLETDLAALSAFCNDRIQSGHKAYAALGECGLDRYWNGEAARRRLAEGNMADDEDGPGTADTAGEQYLFGAQLELARKCNLPVIVHSRDAFEDTLGVIKDAGYDKGVIHCFTYGIPQARAFLDRGWYISFPGTVTFPKRQTDRDVVASLLRYVPPDRMLLETDAPYLAPVPHRGSMNSPLYISHTYRLVASVLGITEDELVRSVLSNARMLFDYSSASVKKGT